MFLWLITVEWVEWVSPETHSKCIYVGSECVAFICMSLNRLKMVQTPAVCVRNSYALSWASMYHIDLVVLANWIRLVQYISRFVSLLSCMASQHGCFNLLLNERFLIRKPLLLWAALSDCTSGLSYRHSLGCLVRGGLCWTVPTLNCDIVMSSVYWHTLEYAHHCSKVRSHTAS